MSSPIRQPGDKPIAQAGQHFVQQGDPYPRPSTSTRDNLRRSSTANSTATNQGALDTATRESENVDELGRNAISTLVQPPILRTGLLPHSAPPAGFKSPTAKDIPPVTLTNISHIDPKAFQPYLSSFGPLYEAFQRRKDFGVGAGKNYGGESQDSVTTNRESTLSPIIATKSAHSRSLSLASNAISTEKSSDLRRKPDAIRRVQAAAPLSTIPNVYCDEDFHLENPRTFDIVSEHSEVITPQGEGSDAVAPIGRKALATNAILQEKLSWYMDTVEVHLISSISTASKSFFSALGSLRELHAEAAESVRCIQNLREDLERVDQDIALSGLRITSLKQRKENVRKLGEAIAQLGDVVASVTLCEELVNRGEVEASMDELDSVERLISGEKMSNEPSSYPYHPRDLSNIQALTGASEDLQTLRIRIGKAYELRFLEALLGDLKSHSEAVPPQATLQRWGSSIGRNRIGDRKVPAAFPTYMNLDSAFRSKLKVELNGLARAHYTGPAAAAFKAQVLKEMKGLIRNHLPSSSDDDRASAMSASTFGGRQIDAKEKSSILARNLRAMDAEDAQSMFTHIYTSVSEYLRRLGIQVKVLLDITSGIVSPPNTAGMRSPLKSPPFNAIDSVSGSSTHARLIPAIGVQEDMQQVLDMSSLLGEAVDFVHQQISKVLKVRTEQVTHLPLGDFLRYFALNRLFADECEAISGRPGNSIKSLVDGHIKDYLNQFSDSQRSRIVQIMDADQWDARDFSDISKEILERVLRSGTQDDPSWIRESLTLRSQNEVDSRELANGESTNGDPTAQGRERIRSAIIDEQRYILSESALAMLQGVEGYQHLAASITSVCPEIAAGLLDTLKIFNSRSSQLILGAGATRSAGLKNITTKHLALASQALSFIIAIIPYVREFFRRHLSNPSSVMAEFDKVKRIFQEHQQGIHEKLVEIMSARASLHVSNMKKIDWEEAARNKARPSSDYIETLTKETGTLHKVLAKHLPEQTVMMIMRPVFSSYKEQLSRAFLDVPLGSDAAKERLLADARVFQSRINKINGSEDLGDHLVNIVAARSVNSRADDAKPSASNVPPKSIVHSINESKT